MTWLLVALLSCAPKEDPAPALSVSPTTADLGTVGIGGLGEATITLHNGGGGAIEVLSASLVEGDARAWAVARDSFEPLAGDTVTTLTITFSPDDEGPSPAQVQIRSDDPEAPSVYVTLTGIGGPSTADNDGDGYSAADGDCDDSRADVHPGGVEVCDGADNDCSGLTDNVDADGDRASLCGALPDCNDSDPTAFPVFVDPSVEPGGTGSSSDPFSSLADALSALDSSCLEVGLASGVYDEATTWNRGTVTLVGLAAEPSGVTFTPAEGSRAFTVTDDATLMLDNVALTGSRPTDGDGGAVLATGGNVTLRGVVASLNTTAGDGGAVALSSGVLTLEAGCAFTDNLAGGDGGAVALVSGRLVDDGTTSWSGNRAIQGGALRAVASTLTLAGGAFTGNTAAGDGGAISLEGSSGVALDRLEFIANSAAGRGGGMALDSVTDVDGWLRNLVFNGNSADQGGAIALTGDTSALLVVNNTFVGNTAAGAGAALLLDSTDAVGLYVWSNVFAWNDGVTGLWAREGSGASIAYNLGYATSSGTDFEVAPGEDLGNNLVSDPLFVDFTDDDKPGNDNVDLSKGSPGSDSGPPDGSGPDTYTSWSDLDGSNNDRGHTGGPGGW